MSLFDDTRADWGARPPLRTLTRIAYANRIGVSWHWIGGGRGPSASGPHSACLRQVKAWQYLHQYGAMKAKDLGYNGLICQHGRAIEGRGVAFSGSHSPGVNDTHIGYQFMVGAGDPPPSSAMIARAVKLRADTDALCPNLRRDWGHRDDPKASTECPGDWIDDWADSGGPTKTKPAPPAVVTAPGVYPGHALRRGDTGPKVTEVQTALGLTADGSYGPGTEAAVRAHQTAVGLDVDGITGPATWASLMEDDMADEETIQKIADRVWARAPWPATTAGNGVPASSAANNIGWQTAWAFETLLIARALAKGSSIDIDEDALAAAMAPALASAVTEALTEADIPNADALADAVVARFGEKLTLEQGS